MFSEGCIYEKGRSAASDVILLELCRGPAAGGKGKGGCNPANPFLYKRAEAEICPNGGISVPSEYFSAAVVSHALAISHYYA